MAQTLGYRTSASVEVGQIANGSRYAFGGSSGERSYRYVVRFAHALGFSEGTITTMNVPLATSLGP